MLDGPAEELQSTESGVFSRRPIPRQSPRQPMSNHPFDSVNVPHGGTLVSPMAGPDRAEALRDASRDWPSWDLTPRQSVRPRAADATAPSRRSTGFMTRRRLRECLRTRCGSSSRHLWSMPITLDVSDDARGTPIGDRCVARAARRGRGDAGGAAGRRHLAARSHGRGPGGVRHDVDRASRRRRAAERGRTPLVRRRSHRGAAARPCTTTTARCA